MQADKFKEKIMKNADARFFIMAEAVILAALLTAGFSGCQKIKGIFIKPPAEGIVQKSYPVSVYAYKSSVVIKATPEEVMNHMVQDFSWLERASEKISGLQMEVQDLKTGADMTRPGQSVSFNMKILLINFPCRLFTLKYKPEKELWLMAIADGTWVLFRVDMKPVPEGSVFDIDILIQLSPALHRIVDFPQLTEAAASRIDLLIAFVQSEFDPDLDIRKVTEKGLRGEAYQKFLQVHDASIWINAPPEKAIGRGLDPDNFREILSGGKIGGLDECLFETENRKLWESGGGLPVFCTDSSIKIAGFEWKGDCLVIIKPDYPEEFFTLYSSVADSIIQSKLSGQPERGGSRCRVNIFVETPGAANPNMLEALISISGLPQWMEKMLLDIKARVEGVG